MKLSWNWLRNFVDLSDTDPETVGKSLTLHTAEVEEVLPLEPFFEKVYAGKLLKYELHPNSEKLHVGQFDVGKRGKKQIIFGSVHQITVGQVFPVALDGAVLLSGLEIKKAEIRGVKSEGMICDNSELGCKNEGLATFSDAEVGKSLPEISEEFRDTVFDIDNKSLTHRPDLVGHRGFAREVAAIFGKTLLLPEPTVVVPEMKEVPLKVKSANCSRFCAVRVDNVGGSGASPLSVQTRLENLDVRAISTLVDITNWMLLEFGQPMHVFDAAKIEGTIVVRPAKKGEKLLALDGEEYVLTPEDTVVADSKKVLSIAGIMGGMESGATEDTKDIIFECAHWDPTAIRKTSQRLGLRSESSMRYEKSLDPSACRTVLLAACEMLTDRIPGAVIASGVADTAPSPAPQTSIQLDPELVRRASGINISDEAIAQKLQSVGFEVHEGDKVLEVDVPSFRATKDIAIPEDLIEEVVRLYGFENIESQLPSLPLHPPKPNPQRNLEWSMRSTLAALGYLETYNYSFVNEGESDFSNLSDFVSVENPLSDQQVRLRQTLIYNLVQNLESDLRAGGRVSFFELGKIFSQQKKVITERLSGAMITASLEADEDTLFFELKRDLEQLLSSLGVKATFTPCEEEGPDFAHPFKSAFLMVGLENIGYIGVLHPRLLPVEGAGVAFVQLDLERLLDCTANKVVKYSRLSPYPSVHRDLSIVLKKDVLIAQIEEVAHQASDKLISIQFFDEFYDAEKLGPDVKNLSFHLAFRSWKKTLTESDIEEHFEMVVNALEKAFGAVLRLKFDQEKTN